MAFQSIPPSRPHEFHRAMVFVDGSNLFERLASAKLRMPKPFHFIKAISGGRQVVRSYLYTTESKWNGACAVHGDEFAKQFRPVFGDEIKTGSGSKEKGVDALLVADLIYHAAARNYDYAILVSTDQDFCRALKRVEDFGCRTAAVSVCATMPALLRQACDDTIEYDHSAMLSYGTEAIV